MKTCKDCQAELPLSEFYRNPHMTDGHLSWCKRCNAIRYRPGVVIRRNRLLAYVQQVKMDRGCADCGYKAHPAALDFDHLPGTKKEYRLAQMSAGSTKRKIDAEMAKCEVVCANCHRIRTAQRRGAAAS